LALTISHVESNSNSDIFSMTIYHILGKWRMVRVKLG
jgi:hypothetical protein